MDSLTLFSRFGLALLIGLLIGLQREQSREHVERHDSFAGLRTFGLLGMLVCRL